MALSAARGVGSAARASALSLERQDWAKGHPFNTCDENEKAKKAKKLRFAGLFQ
jgi:hypothetical protein